MIKISSEIIKNIKHKYNEYNFFSLKEVLGSSSNITTTFNNNIVWASDKNFYSTKLINNFHIITDKIFNSQLSETNNYYFFDNSKDVFISILKEKKKEFIESKFEKDDRGNFISTKAFIASDVELGFNNVIHDSVVIEPGCRIGSNNTIGSDGFGFYKKDSGYDRMPHLSGVFIDKNVSIGNNTCIDRGVISDTLIGEGTKIDNLVHIAHNVDIGKNCLIIANSMIAGSTEIGDDCWIAPSTSINNGLKIGKESKTGTGAVVVKNIKDGSVVAGVPAKNLIKKV